MRSLHGSGSPEAVAMQELAQGNVVPAIVVHGNRAKVVDTHTYAK